MLKTKITKDEFDKLSDDLKAVYKQDGDNYLLQSDEAAQVRSLLETERAERKKLEDEIKEIRDAAKKIEDEKKAAEEEAAREAAKKNKDVDALEASYKAKIEEAKAEGTKEVERLTGIIRGLMVDGEASKMAAEISTVPSLLTPIIKARLNAELTGEKPITRVLDANGQPSAMSLDDLRKEIVANKEFASIIKAGNGSGGGAGGHNSGGGAPKKITDMNEQERVAYYNEVGSEAYRTAAAAEGLPVS